VLRTLINGPLGYIVGAAFVRTADCVAAGFGASRNQSRVFLPVGENRGGHLELLMLRLPEPLGSPLSINALLR
jgi:hypothetical protein